MMTRPNLNYFEKSLSTDPLFERGNLEQLLEHNQTAFDLNPKVLAAVSGGPDSMALLGYLEELDIDYVIVHVNYHHRDTAGRDENIVRQFAQNHHKDLWILCPQYTYGNFQAWAREVRYDFFEQIAHAYRISFVVLGHHLDDHLETWMLQKKRGITPCAYGLQQYSTYRDLVLLRPFLSIEKHELQQWCDEHEVSYGIDESNLSDDYTRNQIRHQTIEPATADQKKIWLEELAEDQRKLEQTRTHIESLLRENNAGKILEDSQNWLILEALLYTKMYVHHSRKAMLDLADKLHHESFQSLGEWNIQIVENQFVLLPATWIPFYIDSLPHLERLCADHVGYCCFKLCDTGKKIEGFAVTEEEFPLIIRQPEAGDRLVQRFGTKKISRLFIDRKIPKVRRPFHAVIESGKGVFFADRAGCDPFHFMESLRFYMLELPV